MINHPPQYGFVPVGLLQQSLKVDVDALEPRLTVIVNLLLQVNELDPPMLGSLAILTDALQLHDRLLVLKLFVPLLQILDDLSSPLHIEYQVLDLRVLLLNGHPKFGIFCLCLIILNEDDIGLLYT